MNQTLDIVGGRVKYSPFGGKENATYFLSFPVTRIILHEYFTINRIV